jgi:lipopolysaccharide export LptBFGC system permease protein LptF
MSLLDRYIARQYVTNIIALLAIVSGFVVSVDLAMNVDRYWKQASDLSGAGESSSGVRVALVTGMLVWDLWWPRLLQLFNYLNGLALVAAMGFTISQLVRHRELVAVLTSGQSLFRVARPIVLVALVMSVVQGVNQQFIIPRIAVLLTRDPGDAGKRNLGEASVPLTKDAQGRLLRATSFDADRNVLQGVYVIERDAGGLATRRITADEARWRDGGWDLVNGLGMARGEAAAKPERVTRLVTSLDPLALKLERYKGMSQNLSWGQIGQLLSSLERSGHDAGDVRRARDRLERIRYGRVATMAANLLTLVVSMTFFLTREPQGMVLRALKCAPVAIVSLVGSVFGSAAAVPGLPPQVFVFVPSMILSCVAVALVSRVRT